MAETLTDNLRVNAGCQGERCVSVPEIVETDPWKAGRADPSVEDIGETVRVDRGAVLANTSPDGWYA
jgi:hypothetical protein